MSESTNWTFEGVISKYQLPIGIGLGLVTGAVGTHYLPKLWDDYNTRKNQETAFYVWQFEQMAKAGQVPQLPRGMVSTGIPFYPQAIQQPAFDSERVYKGLDTVNTNLLALDRKLTGLETRIEGLEKKEEKK